MIGRRLGLVALFVLLALAGDRLLSRAATKAVTASQFRLSMLYRGSIDADIAISGNSRGVHSLFAPRLSERTCRPAFNLSYNGFTTLSMGAVFKDYLERNRPPKFALIEMSAGSAWDRSAGELKTFAPMSERLTRLFEIAGRYRYWSAVTQLYHFNTELFLRSLFYMRHDDQDWIIEGREITADVIRGYGGLEAGALDASERRTAALRGLAQAARDAGTQPIFFIAPYHPVVFERTPALESWLAQQPAVADDVPLLDFSRAIRDDAAFADPIHLNKSGSLRLIELLMQTPQGRALSACER